MLQDITRTLPYRTLQTLQGQYLETYVSNNGSLSIWDRTARNFEARLWYDRFSPKITFPESGMPNDHI